MTIETAFSIGDKVLISADGAFLHGVVVSVWQTSSGLQYETVYWNAGKREKEYFFEFELSLIPKEATP